MSATSACTNTSAAPSASFLARRPVWQVSYLSGLAASVVVEAWGLAARAASVPMRVASLGSHHATPISVGMFAMGTMVVTFWFTFAGGHLIAGAIIIPMVATRLPRVR
jgi:hypothetical protein